MAQSLNIICFFMISMLLTFLTGIKCDNVDADQGSLVFVNILYRHGNRTPVDPYPTDPYKNLSYWPVGWGQLTNEGMIGHYKLGQWLRQRYAGFLPLEYDRSDIYVQSTDVDRTLMSAYSNLAGLYEPDPSKNWSPTIKWRPIPVHTTSEDSDMVMSQRKPCPKFDYALKDLYQTDAFQRLLKDNQVLFESLTNVTGKKMRTFYDVESVFNDLYIESLANLTLPAWAEKFYPDPMRTLADFSFSVECYTPQLARLKIGPLIKEWLNNIQKKIAGKLSMDRKMFVYSGHDETVGNLLQGLGCFNQQAPPFFSTVIMELRNKSANYFVTLYYRNTSLEEPHLLTIPGCAPECPLEELVKLLEPVIPVNWDKECQLSLYEMVNDANGVWIMLYASIASLVIIIAAVTMRSYRRRHPQTAEFVYQSLSAEAT